MTESEYFVKEVQDNRMTPIQILNWYSNCFRPGNNTERGIMANAINDIFMRLIDMGLTNDKRLLVSNKTYELNYKNKQQNTKKVYETSDKYNDDIILTNKKFIKLITLISSSINNPNTNITYDLLDLFKDELQEENNRIESDYVEKWSDSE